jgi:MFS family permease
MRLGWYSDLLVEERRTFWACFAGLGLDSMDTTIFSLVLPTLIALLGISHPEAGILGSAYLIGRRSAAGAAASWPTGSAGCAPCRR